MNSQIVADNIQPECIYLLHGFASAPKYPSDKADVLERVFGLEVKQLVYDSGATFQKNISALKAQVDARPLFFVGTSLVAFYASKLAELFHEQGAMPVLLNPCHNPTTAFQGRAGQYTNFATDECFELDEQAIVSYRDVPFIDRSLIIPRWVLLNLDDELIDAKETQQLYETVLEVFTFEQGGHRFENIGSEQVTTVLDQINNSWFTTGVIPD